jgi:hypothetical protein
VMVDDSAAIGDRSVMRGVNIDMLSLHYGSEGIRTYSIAMQHATRTTIKITSPTNGKVLPVCAYAVRAKRSWLLIDIVILT